jgi:hypothetical protein
MVITDHLTGSDRLVSFGVRCTEPDGDLYLVHLEDEAIFTRYTDVISKIPSIETEQSIKEIRAQLLKEPKDYIESCTSELAQQNLTMSIHEVIELGHRVKVSKELVDRYQIDLVIMNSKDDDQLAMHGLAYPIAIELRNAPLVLI